MVKRKTSSDKAKQTRASLSRNTASLPLISYHQLYGIYLQLEPGIPWLSGCLNIILVAWLDCQHDITHWLTTYRRHYCCQQSPTIPQEKSVLGVAVSFALCPASPLTHARTAGDACSQVFDKVKLSKKMIHVSCRVQSIITQQ